MPESSNHYNSVVYPEFCVYIQYIYIIYYVEYCMNDAQQTQKRRLVKTRCISAKKKEKNVCDRLITWIHTVPPWEEPR